MNIVGYNRPKESKFQQFIKRRREESEKAEILYMATIKRKVECPYCHAIISYRAHETTFGEHHQVGYALPRTYRCDYLADPCPSCHNKNHIQVTKEYFVTASTTRHPLRWYSRMAEKCYPEEYHKRLAAEENK